MIVPPCYACGAKFSGFAARRQHYCQTRLSRPRAGMMLAEVIAAISNPPVRSMLREAAKPFDLATEENPLDLVIVVPEPE